MSSRLPDGWKHRCIGDVLTEHQDRCGDLELEALSLTKGQGMVKASERFGRALHGKDVSRYRHVRRGEVLPVLQPEQVHVHDVANRLFGEVPGGLLGMPPLLPF